MMMLMMMSMNECLRCGWEWESRVEGRPKNCPGCKSPVWDRAKVESAVAAKAHKEVADAVRNGILEKMPCEVCGEIKVDAHHEDYEKPLEVNWLCRKHHRQRHVEIGGPLMRGALNLRGVPDDLAKQLKYEAKSSSIKFNDYCVAILEQRGHFGLTVARMLDGHGNVEPRKKIADISVGGGATEGGGDPCLPRGGKAQEMVYDGAGTRVAQDGYFETKVVDAMLDNLRESGRQRDFPDSISCGHAGCLSHLSHPCEGCGRIGGRRVGVLGDGTICDENPVQREEENNGAKGSGEAGQDKRTYGGDSQPVAEGDHGSEKPAVGVGKPRVNMQALRDICAGKMPRNAQEAIAEVQEYDRPDPHEVDLCGFKSYNETDGEWYVCTKEKHGTKIKHGEWLKV